MKVNFSQLDRGYLKYQNEYEETIKSVLESGWYVLGENVEQFEQEFSTFVGTDYCVGLNSGLDALILAFRALDIGPGDEVIVPANTYIASVIGITENNATPIFVEPDEFYNLDASKIEEKITSNTKAILVVHLYGQAANMQKIQDIANKHELYLVEDCAQSHGANFADKTTGAWGDIGCFSFYPTKNLGAFGDGGAITTNNVEIYEKIKMFRNYGSKEKYQHEILGINTRLDEIQAALLRVKLKHYNELMQYREDIAVKYLSGIKNEKVELPRIRNYSDHIWHLFVIKTKERDLLQTYLENKGINTQIHYPIPPHLSKAYKSLGYSEGDFPITESYSNEILSLPLFEGMTEKEIDYVINAINEY